MTDRICRPGQSLAVIGDSVTVLLPPHEKARAVALWELVDDGGGVDVVLDRLVTDGLTGLTGFVLVGERDGVTRVIVRGAAHATLESPEGTVEVEGPRDAVWAERSVSGATGFRVVVEELSADVAVPVVNGLTRSGHVEAGSCAAPALRPVQDAEAGTTPVEGTADGPAAVVPAVAVDHGPELDPAPSPVEPAVINSDDPTEIGLQPAGLEVPAYGLPGTPAPPAVTAEPVARLHFSSGEVIDVDRPVVVGRDPRAQRPLEGEGQPLLVQVPSPNHEVSSTHLEVRPGAGADHGSAVVTDLGSTNGTVLVQPGLPPEDLRSGVAQQLVPGAIIDLGDGVTIQVTQP